MQNIEENNNQNKIINYTSELDDNFKKIILNLKKDKIKWFNYEEVFK